MRNLEHILVTWKPLTVDAEELGDWVRETHIRLNKLKTVAKNHKVDAEVVASYDATLELLGCYKSFLNDVAFIDFHSGVAKPEQKNFLSRVGTKTVEGTAAGLGVGTVMLPVVGSASGAVVGAGLGAAAGALDWWSDHADTLEKSQQVDAATKTLMKTRAKALRDSWLITMENLKDQAKILAGEQRYGWGNEVGFDGSDRLPLHLQTQRRPNDSFLHVTMAVREASTNPAVAADKMIAAANLVPHDLDASVDFLDLDRADYFLVGARIAEEGARKNGDTKLAAKAVDCFQRAVACLHKGDDTIPDSAKLIHARACALAGRSYEADTTMAALLRQRPNDADLLYEYAGIKGQQGQYDAALGYLRRSFEIRPRWHPLGLTDSRLTKLRANRGFDVTRVCVNPLVGTWHSDKWKLTMKFYMDGKVKQTMSDTTIDGTFQEKSDGTLRVVTPSKTKVLAYRLANDRLTLDNKYELRRVPPRLMGRWKFGNDLFEFRDDGTWRKENRDEVTTGTYCILPTSPFKPQMEILYTRPDLLLGDTVKRVSFDIRGDSLFITVPGDANSYEYKRP